MHFAAINGWTSIKNNNGNPTLVASSYNHIFGTGDGKFIDQSGKNWLPAKMAIIIQYQMVLCQSPKK